MTITTYLPDSRFARVLDRTLDMLLVMVLLGAPLIFYTKGNDVFEFNKFTAVRDFSVLAAILFAIKFLYVRPLTVVRASTDIPLLAWLACCFISAFWTANSRLSMHGVYEDFEGLTSLINYALLLYFVQQHVRNERQIRIFIGAVILAGTISGFYGMLQNFGIDFVPWNPTTYSADRMFSTMGNPDFLAAYLVMSLPICLVVVLDLPGAIRTDKNFCAFLAFLAFASVVGLCVLFHVNFFNFDPSYYDATSTFGIFITVKFWIMHILLAFPLIAALLLYYGRLRDVLLISMIFQVIAILFTKSRGGGVALGIIYILVLAYAIWDVIRGSKVWRNNWILLVVFHCLLVLALIFIPSVRETAFHMFGRLFQLTSVSNIKLTPRLYIWRSALQMMGDHFWFGSGLDTFQIVFPQYRTALYWILEWNGTPEKAHNVVMQTAATMGIAGLLTYFWLNVSVIVRVFKDLVQQQDSSRRLLMVGCFAAAAAFFTQDLFSFTVVGYGSLYWMLIAFIPAMHRTWMEKDAVQPLTNPTQGLAVWRAGMIFIAGVGLLALVAGPNFSVQDDGTGARVLLAVLGVGVLGYVCIKGMASDALRLGLLGTVALGYFLYAVYATRIWVADSFYKQGQVGIQMNNPEFAAAMYQKAAGRIVSITPDQEQMLYSATLPTTAASSITFTPGLNPDQELYWVKMGIAFEDAASAATKPEDKMTYFRTALAIHELSLQMNPINGYNYNNKGRVLKSMGEAFGNQEYFKRALDHYAEAIRLDPNNVYFNLDYATTYIDLGDYGHALEVCQSLMEKFPDFALPYSYAAFVKLRQNLPDESINYFQQALAKDWKGDNGSRALAATNLGVLLEQKKRYPEAAKAYSDAVQSNSEMVEPVEHWGQMLAKLGHKAEAIELFQGYLAHYPNSDPIKQMLGQLGVKP